MNGVRRVVLLLLARESLCATLEEIAEREGTDKARDEHGYVSAYAMLFDGMRDRVRNVTEIGIHFVRASSRSPTSAPCPALSSEFSRDLCTASHRENPSGCGMPTSPKRTSMAWT